MSNNLGLAIYTVGGDYDSWGDKIIADHGRIDRALGDVLTIANTTGTVTLTQDQSNYAVHRLTGTLTGNLIVDVIAGVQRVWMVRNATSGAFSVTYRVAGGAGASVSITQGRSATVISDGVDCVVLDLSTLSGQVVTAQIADNAVTTAKIAANAVTKAKLEQIASYRVLGNLSGSTANVAEVTVSNDPTMAAGSQTSLVTEYATKTLISSTAFSSALPSQAGNARKIPTSDGTNASWTFPAFDADIFRVRDNTDTTKQVAFAVSGVSTGTTRTLALPNQSGTIALTSDIPQTGQRTFTATGTLPNGATVVLNSDGTVSTVTSNNDTTGTAAVFRSAATTWIASAPLSATSVVVCYYDGSGGYAVIGTVSGTGVIFGTAVTFTTSAATYTSVCALSSTSFAVAWREGNDTFGKARVGSVSGTTISFPAAAVNFNPANTAHISIAALSSTAVVIAYQDGGNSSYGTAIIGTISGTTITFGSEYMFNNANNNTAIAVAALSATTFVVGSFNSADSRVYVGTVSGTAISYGTGVVFETGSFTSFYTSIVALTSTTFMVAWARGTTDGRAKIGTVSGTTVSFTGASDVVFNSAITSFISAVKISATQVAVAYADTGNSSYGTIVIGTISGLSIVFGSEIVFRSGGADYVAGAVAGDKIFIGYKDNANSSYGTGVVFWPASTNVADWQGITAASIANGASGLVTVRGGYATNLSGLTPKADYYLNNDGTLTTTVTSYKIGRAMSSSVLEIRGNA